MGNGVSRDVKNIFLNEAKTNESEQADKVELEFCHQIEFIDDDGFMKEKSHFLSKDEILSET